MFLKPASAPLEPPARTGRGDRDAWIAIRDLVGRRGAPYCLSLLLFGAVTSSGAGACGLHQPQTIARTLLNLHYPDSLHVDGAVWAAQREGWLPLDRKRLQATGAERKLLDTRAYFKTLQALQRLNQAFEQAASGEAQAGLALVLTETLLWTRFPASGAMQPHVKGPDADDLVVVSDEPVLRAIADGDLTVIAAIDKGLMHLYGSPEQERLFTEAYGTVGDQPLPAADNRRLLALLYSNRQAQPNAACTVGDCGRLSVNGPR